MSTYYAGSTEARTQILGRQVTKTAVALPQTASATLFTITGGRVLITGFQGIVTTVTASTTCTFSLGFTPAGGSANTTGITSAMTSIGTLAVGSQISLNATPGSALVATAANAVGYDQAYSLVLPAGVITCTTGASITGNVTWSLTYVMLDNGGAVN